MGYSKTISRFCAIATTTLVLSTLNLHLSTDNSHFSLSLDTAADAKRSGGRSGGGSFRRTSPSRSPDSSPSHTSPSRPSQDRRYDGGGPVIVPVPVGPTHTYPSHTYSTTPSGTTRSNDTGNLILGLIVLTIGAIIFIILVVLIVRAIRKRMGGGNELENQTVTVTKLQVALLAQARSIQAELTQLSLDVETDSEWGLTQLLQESALALLRTPENWSHVLASSDTVKSREEAEKRFSQLSIAERSKFTVETLSNVGGKVRKQEGYTPDADKDPASYIVVTLLVGTAHDKPLFGDIRTTEALQAALEKLAAIPAEYLMVFELIWTPQDASDSLTYDELLLGYAEMVQI